MSKIDFASRVRRMLSPAAVLVVVASCGGGGGDDGGTTNPPGAVSRVDITAPSPTMEVGQTMQVTVRYYDAASKQLNGRSVTYATSNSGIATVSTAGLVTAAAPGAVTITATVDGVQGNLSINIAQVPVFFILITPANPSVRPGETITLAAQPQNSIGQPLTGRPITWSSANTARATISQGGVVTGVSTGSVYIRAATEGHVDSVNLRVRSLVAPSITGTSSITLAPGGTGSLTGTNFGATIAENEVIINGVRAAVASATSTSVTFTVPAKTQLPCTATGPAQVALVANGDTALTTMFLKVATEFSLAVGQHLLLTDEADLVCNEFTGTGARYLITAFNYGNNAGVRTSFRLTGSAAGSVAASVVQASAPAPAVARTFLPDDAITRHMRAHSIFMSQERQLAKQLGSPGIRERLERSKALRSQAAIAPPAVGDQLTYRMRKSINTSSTYDEVAFRVVYSGTKLVILEDNASPRAGQMDPEYVRIGEEFDGTMYDMLSDFGDPLVVDSALDNNGRMLALFSPRVNNYVLGGKTNQILGFVTLCDFFERSFAPCASSNEGEVFYALIPDPSAGWTITSWRRSIRGTLIHEAKHVASYAWRYYFNASEIEETWLEEATAQAASELWARHIYQRGVKQDLGWADGPRCDYAPPGGACPDPAEGILHHFGWLYDHYAALDSKSILDDPFGPLDAVIYGSSWSFVRYIADVFSPSEGALFSALNKVQNDHGVSNVVSKTGKPFSELLGMFSLASTADNYPGGTINDPKLRLPSWNSRDLFSNMSANLTSGGAPAFPLPWPLLTRQVSYGNFNSVVDQLRGGGWVAWELSGTQTGAQAMAIRSSEGGTAPPLIGMTILRIQ